MSRLWLSHGARTVANGARQFTTDTYLLAIVPGRTSASARDTSRRDRVTAPRSRWAWGAPRRALVWAVPCAVWLPGFSERRFERP